MRKCGNMCLYRRALTGVFAVLLAVEISACGGKAKPGQETGVNQKAEITQEKASAPVWKDMRPERSMELSYAKQFSVDYYDGGYDLIQVQDDSTCLVVPEGAAVPEGLPASITVLQKPLDHVYLAATSAMDLIAALGRVDRITLSGTKESGWYVDAARQAMEDGTLSYAGKYSAPDYEQILSSGCDLALESTMIYHVPDVKAQLEQLKIPVFVERSSYEEHPLGRMEWIRLYGVLGYSDRTPAKYTMTFPKGYNAPSLKQENLIIKRVVPENYEFGRIEIESPSGNPIRVYDLERTLCDILRGSGSDVQIVGEAMKRYAASKDKNIHKLMQYADQLRVKPKVLRYMEVLL